MNNDSNIKAPPSGRSCMVYCVGLDLHIASAACLQVDGLVCVCRIANPCCKYMLVCKCQASQTAPACCMAQQITNCCSHVANGVKYPVALRCLGPIGKKAYEWKLTVSSVEENSAHDNNMSSSEMNKTYLVHMMIALPVPTSPTMHGIGTVTPPCLPLFAGIGSPWIALRDHSHNQQTGIA